MTPVAIVTGASSGIGAATCRALASAFTVHCVARRADRLSALAAEIGGVAHPCDLTDPDAVLALADQIGDVDLLVNNAGGAFGLEPVADADLGEWQRMYDINVLGTARVTQAFLPALRRASGTVVFITSTAAESGYEGGAGYCGAKMAERAIAESMRLELWDQPVRVCEISPGMVHTDEFSLTRFGGDQAKADAVYAGVAQPLLAEDVADVIRFVATRPSHVNVDRLIVRPRAQASQHKVFRG